MPLQSFFSLQLDECFLIPFFPLLRQSFDIFVYHLARHPKNAGEIRGGQERIFEVQSSGMTPRWAPVVPRFSVFPCAFVFYQLFGQ